MAIRCKSIAAQKINLNPGDKIIAGCELIKGSILVDAEEGYPLQFVVEDGFAGSDGATVLWPESGNDVYQYSPNERVPVGTFLAGPLMEEPPFSYPCPTPRYVSPYVKN